MRNHASIMHNHASIVSNHASITSTHASIMSMTPHWIDDVIRYVTLLQHVGYLLEGDSQQEDAVNPPTCTSIQQPEQLHVLDTWLTQCNALSTEKERKYYNYALSRLQNFANSHKFDNS